MQREKTGAVFLGTQLAQLVDCRFSSCGRPFEIRRTVGPSISNGGQTIVKDANLHYVILCDIQARSHEIMYTQLWIVRPSPTNAKHRQMHPAIAFPTIDVVRSKIGPLVLRRLSVANFMSACVSLLVCLFLSVAKERMRQRTAHKAIDLIPRTPDVILDMLPPVPDGQCKLENDVNERLAFHGTSSAHVESIAQEGFDERLADEGGLYGMGIYFAEESCKSFQYCKRAQNDEHCIMVVRLILGRAYIAQGPMQRQRRPPQLDQSDASAGLFDSVVVNRGTPNGQALGTQQHREFVLFAGEHAYPEMVIYFKV